MSLTGRISLKNVNFKLKICPLRVTRGPYVTLSCSKGSSETNKSMLMKWQLKSPNKVQLKIFYRETKWHSMYLPFSWGWNPPNTWCDLWSSIRRQFGATLTQFDVAPISKTFRFRNPGILPWSGWCRREKRALHSNY